MYGNTVYLEAADRTQDLLNIKWALRSAGFIIASSWHDGDATACRSTFNGHCSAQELDALDGCDLLVVVCGRTADASAEMSLTAGFALGRRIQVCWIGGRVELLKNLTGVQVFDTVEQFYRHILTLASQRASLDAGVAA
jgi:hypothetical protein